MKARQLLKTNDALQILIPPSPRCSPGCEFGQEQNWKWQTSLCAGDPKQDILEGVNLGTF